MATIPTPATAAKIKAADVLFLVGGAAGRSPSFRTRLAVAPANYTSNVETVVKYDTVDEDTDSGYATGTGLYTCVTAGLWLFTASLAWTSNGTGLRLLKLVSTGSPSTSYDASAGTIDVLGRTGVSLITRLTAGQTVSATGLQVSGGGLAPTTGANVAFCGCWLAA